MNITTVPPAHLVIRAFGGVRATAAVLRCNPSSVSRWQISGRVPSAWQREILELAWKNNLDLTAHDLIFGRQP